MDGTIVCISEAASDLGLTRQTVSELARKIGVEFIPFPRTRNGKGLSSGDVELLRSRTTPIERRPAVPVTTG